jgi:hypothetical protein
MLFGLNFEASTLRGLAGEVSKRYGYAVRNLSGSEQKSTGKNSSNAKSNELNNSAVTEKVDLSEKAEAAQKTFKAESELSEEERKKVEELKRIDQAVKAHEQAHKAAGGQYVRGGANYEYRRGPDGKLYAVGGEVQIDVSAVEGDPEATIKKMETVRRAALAPQDPSPQDRRVAAEATRRENRARIQLQKEKFDESTQNLKTPDGEFKQNQDLPGSDAAIADTSNIENYKISPPENLFELFA